MSIEDEPSRDDIERRAFQLYMVRGRHPGDELADWLAAERELREECTRTRIGSHRSFSFRKAACT